MRHREATQKELNDSSRCFILGRNHPTILMSTSEEAVPKPYTKSTVVSGGVRSSGAIEIMMRKLTDEANQLAIRKLSHFNYFSPA